MDYDRLMDFYNKKFLLQVSLLMNVHITENISYVPQKKETGLEQHEGE